MERASISVLTICGLDELDSHGSRGVTHVLSILDPGWPDPTCSAAGTVSTAPRCASTTSSTRCPARSCPSRSTWRRSWLSARSGGGCRRTRGRPPPHPLPHGHLALHRRDDDAARAGEPGERRGGDHRAAGRDPSPGLAEPAHDRVRGRALSRGGRLSAAVEPAPRAARSPRNLTSSR